MPEEAFPPSEVPGYDQQTRSETLLENAKKFGKYAASVAIAFLSTNLNISPNSIAVKDLRDVAHITAEKLLHSK